MTRRDRGLLWALAIPAGVAIAIVGYAIIVGILSFGT